MHTMWLLVIQVSLKSIKCLCLLPKCHLMFHKVVRPLECLSPKFPSKLKAPQTRYNYVRSVVYFPNLHVTKGVSDLSYFPIATEVTLHLKQHWFFYISHVCWSVHPHLSSAQYIMTSHTLLPFYFTLVNLGNSTAATISSHAQLRV